MMSKKTKELILAIVVVCVGIVTGIIAYNSVNGNNNGEEKNIANESTESNEEQQQPDKADEVEDKSTTDLYSSKSKIAQAIIAKKFLSDNDINDEQVKVINLYRLVDGEHPIYIISTKYDKRGIDYGKTFIATYNDNKVGFTVLDEGKNMPGMYIDAEQKVIKTELVMQECTRSTFYVVAEGKLEEKDTFVKPANAEAQELIEFSYNGDDVSEEEYNEKIEEYSKYNFKSYDELSVDCNEETIENYIE